MSKIPTTLEQTITMYSLTDSTIEYWVDWAKKFVECCESYLDFDIEAGPGTSLGTIMHYPDAGGNFPNLYYPFGSAAWDCDWTQENGIYSGVDKKYNNCPLYTGWFYEYEPWVPELHTNGIDEENGRFDIIVYMASNAIGEKIGFRIKYPICSVGYSDGNWRTRNYIWGCPGISIYSSLRQDIENKYLDVVPTNALDSDYYYTPNCQGFVRFFAKSPLRYTSDLNNYNYWGKGDLNDSLPNSTTRVVSLKWSKEIQNSDSFSINTGTSTIVKNRLFKYYWKKFNKFHYHISKNTDTVYLYVSQDSKTAAGPSIIEQGPQVGFKIICTTLENGEKGILIENHNPIETNQLCEMAATTGGVATFNNGNMLIQMPYRPYTKTSSGVNRFSLSRMLIPTQKELCTDLYYVVKRDTNETIGNGQYVTILDKNKRIHYFRVIPFGSRFTYEVEGDNTTYLAFPIVGDDNDSG